MSYHAEIRELLAGIEDGALAEGGIFPGIDGLKTQAERLLALPEASIEALMQAAQLGVGAVEAALCTGVVTESGLQHDGDTCPIHEDRPGTDEAGAPR
jgi:hypothetical protein